MMDKIWNGLAQIQVSPDDLDIPRTDGVDNSNVSSIITFVFAIAFGVALIVIIISGIQFMLSQGDPGKSANARNTIIYAAVGLALASASYGIVRYIVSSL
jgi:Type IV secretion system pilin